jgi:poly(hydroxyalkanoate) granule associated protein phasin
MPKRKPGSAPHMKSLKEPQDLTAHSIWLAGLGALAVAEEDKGTEEEKGLKLFTHLVERGRDIEARGRVKIIKGKIQGIYHPRLGGDQVKISKKMPRGRTSVERRRDIEARGRVKVIKRKIQGIYHPRLGGDQVKISNKVPRRRTSARLATILNTGPLATPTAEVAHLRRNAEARTAFLAEFGTLTSGEVAELAGSSAANRAALANRWKAEGRIFAVETGGQTLFPAFQFLADNGQPRPVIAEILAVLQPRLSGWQTALWFTGRNGWLGAKRPVEVLASDPSTVVEAARQEAVAFD